jgi:hypothetical protein
MLTNSKPNSRIKCCKLGQARLRLPNAGFFRRGDFYIGLASEWISNQRSGQSFTARATARCSVAGNSGVLAGFYVAVGKAHRRR